MPFTLVGWSESQDSGGVLVPVAALADPHVRVVGDDIIVPELNKLMGIAAFGLNLTQAQLQSPTLRRFVNLDLRPCVVAALITTIDPFIDLRKNPIELAVDEALNALISEDNAGAVIDNVFAWLGDGDLAIPDGEIFTVRATSATTCVANAWTNGALTFTQALPAGRYALVGARGESTNLKAFRFVFTGSPWRPGALGYAGIGTNDFSQFRMGKSGVWGEFAHNTPPTVDFMAGAADAAEVLHLDLVKLS